MTEEQIENEPGRVKRFFRWVFVAVKWLFVLLLAILLIGGLYFKAPLKVLTLIGIILATLTIIPKRKRKWIWLTFVIIVLGLVVWVFLPDEDGDWRPYTFDEELAALEAKRAIPDDQNAAIIYNKLIETYDSNDFYPEFMDDELNHITRHDPWSSQDHPQLAEWIDEHNEIIEFLLKACEKDQCWFPPIYSDPASYRKTFDYLRSVTPWNKVLVRAANNDLAHGRIEQALAKKLAVLQMANHIYQQPGNVFFLIGLAVEGIAINQLKDFVIKSGFAEQHLSAIDKAIEDIDFNWSSDLARILDCVRMNTKNFLGMFYQVNAKGKIRFVRNSLSIFPGEMHRPLSYWQKRLYRALSIYYWLVLPTTPQAAGRIVDKEFSDYYEMASEDYPWPDKSPMLNDVVACFRLFSSWVGCKPAKALYHMQYEDWLEAFARRHATRIIVALRRYKNKHGRWPGSLEEVKSSAPVKIFIDPVNNDSFVYKLTEADFTLYSKGKNNIDENGDWSIKKPDGTYTDDLLIWPSKSRKAGRPDQKKSQ